MSDRSAILAQRKQLISEAFQSALSSHGFAQLSPVVWSRPLNDSIQAVVSLGAMKGGSVSPRWGYRLAYVPAIKGDRLAAKGKNDGGVIDLVFDPIDYDAASGPSSWLVSYEPFEGHDLPIRARRLANRTAEACTAFFAPVKSLADLPAEFDRKKTRPFVRFGWDNYVTEPLAYALTLAKLGQLDNAKTMLASWVDRHQHRFRPDLRAKVEQFLQSATEP